MPKRRAEAPLGQASPEEQADIHMVNQDGSIPPRNSMEQDSNDPQAQSDHPDQPSLEGTRAHAEGSGDITMGSPGSEEEIKDFKSSLTLRLDALKDGGRRQGDGGTKGTEEQKKQNDKDEERHQKKKRLEAEEGAGSGRYNMWY